MMYSIRSFTVLSVLSMTTVGLTACGTAQDLLSEKGYDSSQQVNTPTSDNQDLLDQSLGLASGMADPQFRPYRLDTLGLDDHQDGPRDGGGRGHHKGPHSRDGRDGHGKQPPAPRPAEIIDLMKAADAKKDSVLGIDRTKIDPILQAMRSELELLRSIAGSRELFMVKAKEIQDKYAEQLKAALPAFDGLTQEQKDRVKAIHELQKKVVDSCIARGADSASATCSTAKTELKANIDSP